jgi:ABC-type lipoprotein export system ATPase subunit
MYEEAGAGAFEAAPDPVLGADGQSSPYALEIDALTKHYWHDGDVCWALQGVSLGVTRGSFIVVTGPVGAGKSTLLACVAGLETPTSGTIHRHDSVRMPVLDGTPLPPPVDGPELILADDPAKGMNEEQTRAVIATLRGCSGGDQRTVLVTTDDPVLAGSADVVLFMVEGRLVDAMTGPPADLVAEHLGRLTT